MNTQPTLQEHLTKICQDAIDANWNTISPYLKDMALNVLRDRNHYGLNDIVGAAVSRGFDAALKLHIETTFVPVLDQIAKDSLAKNLYTRLKRRGLSTDQLDALLEKNASGKEEDHG